MDGFEGRGVSFAAGVEVFEVTCIAEDEGDPNCFSSLPMRASASGEV